MPAIDSFVAFRAGGVQALLVGVLSILLAVALPHHFFVHWGWLAGPAAWMLCAAGTARAVHLPLGPTLVGAALAGLPSILAVVAGVHWLGALLAIVLFALWCGARAGTTPRVASARHRS